jgi:hypothetical protein
MADRGGGETVRVTNLKLGIGLLSSPHDPVGILQSFIAMEKPPVFTEAATVPSTR